MLGFFVSEVCKSTSRVRNFKQKIIKTPTHKSQDVVFLLGVLSK